jgi:CarboxypepD_reg-like domain/TonB-dependent Receptor Plug Domain
MVTNALKSFLFPLFFIAIFMVNFESQANVMLSGIITDKNTHKPIVGATISILGSKKGAATNQNGAYSLKIPFGRVTVKVSAVGFYSKTRELDITDDTVYDVELTEEIKDLDEVEVKGKKADANIKSIEMSTVRLNLQNIKKIPVVFGEVDIIKALLLQPGVSTVGEGAGGFNVRGGRVDQNLILLDEAPVFNSSHLLGFFANVNPDILQDVTLLKGGIPAQYGGRLSSLVKMSTKTGNTERVNVSGGVGNISTKLLVEGPISNKLTFLAATRIAYPNWIIKQFPKRFENSRGSFYDTNLKLNFKPNTKHNLAVSYYRGYDDFKFPEDTSYAWKSEMASLQWGAILSKKLSLNTALIYSNYKFEMEGLKEFLGFLYQSSIKHQEIKTGLLFSPNEAHKLEFGGNIIRYNNGLGERNPSNDKSNINPKKLEPEQATEMAAYISEEWVVSPTITLQTGLRYSQFSNYGAKTVAQYLPNLPKSIGSIAGQKVYQDGENIQTYSGLEPRISMRVGLSELMSLKMSYNRMRQYLHLISNTTAISPVDYWKLSDTYIPPQVGDQYAVGLFRNFNDNTFETSIEAYYKDISSIIEYKNGATLLLNPFIETDLITAIGKAYGIEFSVKKNKGKLTGQANYSYARSLVATQGAFSIENVNQGAWFPSTFDKPHTLNISTTYNLGRGWNYSANFTYSTGRPAIYPDGTYAYKSTPIINYSLRNQDRIPDYHRLDMSFSWETRKKKEQKRYGTWVFSMYNFYGRQNPYSIYFTKFNKTTQSYQLTVFGSIIPSLTWNYNF